jgi:membrane protease YdiL (CAAX protease family)
VGQASFNELQPTVHGPQSEQTTLSEVNPIEPEPIPPWPASEPELPPPPPQPLKGSRFRRALWLPGDAALASMLALLMAGAVFGSSQGMFEGVPKPIMFVLGGVMEFGVMLAIPLWLLRRRTDPALVGPRPRRSVIKEFLLAIPSTIAVLFSTGVVVYAVQLVLMRLGHPPESALDYWGEKSERSLVPLILLATIVAPIVEEIFFRGFLYNSLRTVFPAWLAAIGQALLFGAGHIYEPLGIFATFVIGLMLATIYEWRKTLLTPMIVHCMYNSLVMVVIATTIMANANGPIIGVGFARDDSGGAVVELVVPGGPAEKAGIQPGDVIVKYDGHDVTDSKQLTKLIRAGKVGDKVEIEVTRSDERMTMHLELRSRKEIE